MWRGNLLRLALLAVLAYVSLSYVHVLDLVVALCGALLGIPLSVVYPAAIHLRLVPQQPPGERARALVLGGAGVVLALGCASLALRGA